MAARAGFLFIDYLKSIINPLVAPDTIGFHPGKTSPSTEDQTFANYTYFANVDYTQPYLHLDTLQVRIHHTDYMTLKNITDRLLRLNKENPYENPGLIAAGLAEGIKWQDVVIRTADSNQNQFVESTDYFYDILDILLQYTELPDEGNVSAFIEGQ